jgi:class 3 adenylate cyclase/streptogramin lyase
MQRRTSGRGLAAVLFTDIVGSTAIAAEMGNTRWVELVDRHHRIVRRQIGRFGGREIDTAGDGFFVTFERPADAIRCAVAASEAVRELGIEIRAGVSFGQLETAGHKPGGLAVNTAARVMSVGGPGEVLVPASVREIVSGAGITFAEHGVHRLKGLEGEFRLSSVTGVDGTEIAPPLEEEQAAERRRNIFPTGTRRTALIVGLAGGVLVVAAVAWVLLGGEPTERSPGAGPLRNSAVRIDPETGQVKPRIPIPGAVNRYGYALELVDHPMVVGEGGVWLLRPPRLLHIDPLHADVRSDAIGVGVGTSQTVSAGFGSIWVLTDRTLLRVHPGTDEAEPFLVLPPAPGIATYALALDEKIWVADSDGTLVRIDASTQARDQAETGLNVGKMALTENGLWVADVLLGEVVRVDLDRLRPTMDLFEIGGGIDQMTGDGDDLWVLDTQVGLVTRVNTVSGGVRSTRIGDNPTDMAVGLGAVWIGDEDGSIYRVDTTTLDVEELPIGAQVLAVGVDETTEMVWAYVGSPVGTPVS